MVGKVKIQLTWGDFFNWLEENYGKDTLIRYFKNVDEQNPQLPDTRSERPTDWLMGAFAWCDTPETHEYWGAIHRKWTEELKNAEVVFVGDKEEFYRKSHINSYVSKWYEIRDFSYNREVNEKTECKDWIDSVSADIITPTELLPRDRKGIILEEPTEKNIFILGNRRPKDVVKVYIPALKKIVWVLFKKDCVIDKNDD